MVPYSTLSTITCWYLCCSCAFKGSVAVQSPCSMSCNLTWSPRESDTDLEKLRSDTCVEHRKDIITYNDTLKVAFGGIPLVSRDFLNCGSRSYDKCCAVPARKPQPPSTTTCALDGTRIEEIFRYFVALEPAWCRDFGLTMMATSMTTDAWSRSHSLAKITKMVRLNLFDM